MATDFLEAKRREIEARLRELKPLVDEYARLEAAERALASAIDGSATPGAAGRPGGRGGAGRAAAEPAAGRRRGRPRGSGTRGEQALTLIRERPGITIRELAEAMGIKQNYLYRLLPALQQDGRVVKSGQGWHPRSV